MHNLPYSFFQQVFALTAKTQLNNFRGIYLIVRDISTHIVNYNQNHMSITDSHKLVDASDFLNVLYLGTMPNEKCQI